MVEYDMHINIHSELHYVHLYHTYMGYKETFIPYMHMDLRLFYNILVCKQVMKMGIVDSSINCLKCGDDLHI